jgi:hypothetical protein
MEWYNQTFQRHPVRDRGGKIVDIATAFEVLLELPSEGIRGAFRVALEALLGGSKELSSWANQFYDIRSGVVHRGRTDSLLYKHPDATIRHLDFLWSAQRIYRWCIEIFMGEKRGLHSTEIEDLFTSNEVHLKRLKKAGSFNHIRAKGLLHEVSKLRPAHPVGKQQDIIWLGKLLLRAYKERYMTDGDQTLPTLDIILKADDNDPQLDLKYYDFHQEFEAVYFRYIAMGTGSSVKKDLKILKPIPMDNPEQIQMENAIYNFANFAGFALLLPPRR